MACHTWHHHFVYAIRNLLYISGPRKNYNCCFYPFRKCGALINLAIVCTCISRFSDCTSAPIPSLIYKGVNYEMGVLPKYRDFVDVSTYVFYLVHSICGTRNCRVVQGCFVRVVAIVFICLRIFQVKAFTYRIYICAVLLMCNLCGCTHILRL